MKEVTLLEEMAAPYKTTYSVRVEGGDVFSRTVTIIFESEEDAEAAEIDYFDDCRGRIQDWLNKHFPGEIICDDGDDIEASGLPPDNDDPIDMRSLA